MSEYCDGSMTCSCSDCLGPGLPFALHLDDLPSISDVRWTEEDIRRFAEADKRMEIKLKEGKMFLEKNNNLKDILASFEIEEIKTCFFPKNNTKISRVDLVRLKNNIVFLDNNNNMNNRNAYIYINEMLVDNLTKTQLIELFQVDVIEYKEYDKKWLKNFNFHIKDKQINFDGTFLEIKRLADMVNQISLAIYQVEFLILNKNNLKLKELI